MIVLQVSFENKWGFPVILLCAAPHIEIYNNRKALVDLRKLITAASPLSRSVSPNTSVEEGSI